MTTPIKIEVLFYSGYTGSPKAGVWIDDKEHVLEIDELRELLEKMIQEKGYTVSQTKRQKYPRITINQ